VSDDDVTVFVKEIAFSSVAKVFEAFEPFIHVLIQIIPEAQTANVKLIADVFMLPPDGLQIESRHASAHNRMFMMDTAFIELSDLVFRKLDASHWRAPRYGHKVSENRKESFVTLAKKSRHVPQIQNHEDNFLS